jgi:hypothetical protein
MGLDSVELLVTVENHFGINIPDREAEQIRTVHDFASCIAKYISISSDSKCKSQMLFYILRDYITEEVGFAKEKFLPSTIINDVIPFENRKDVWNKIETDLNIELPQLSKKDVENDISFFKALFSKERLTDKTIRDLVNWILSLNHKKLMNVGTVFSINEIERILIGVISETNGLEVEEIEPHHRIVEDLGIS